MNNRLTVQDMAGLLTEYTGKDKKETERFLRMLISVLTDGVFTDKSVKVKGLGTFKIATVEKRESIHVNTGERFLIPEHYKFSFLPDKELKELVNKPFSFFETVEIDENIEFSDLDQTEEEDYDEASKNREEETEAEEETFAEEKLPVAEDSTTSVTEPEIPPVLPKMSQEKENEHEQEEQAIKIEKKTEIEEPVYSFNESLRDEYVPNHHSFLKRTVILLFSFALIGIIGAYLFFDFKPFLTYKYNEGYAEDVDIDAVEDQSELSPVIEPDSLSLSDHIDSTMTTQQTDTVIEETETRTKEEPSKKAVAQTTTQKPEKNILAKIKIKAGDRLTLISLEYYGSKIFWVYLYEHNKRVISNPNNVPINTEIEVPAPELYGIDVHNRTSIDKAATLQTQILSGEK